MGHKTTLMSRAGSRAMSGPGGAQGELTVEKMIWTLIGEPGSLTRDQRRGGQWKSAFPS